MFCDPWTLQVAQEILTGEFIVLELRRIITRMHAEEKLQRPFTENRMMKQMRFFKKDLTLNMCSEKNLCPYHADSQMFFVFVHGRNCFHKRDVYHSQPAGIDHSQAASSKWWLPGAQGFLLFVQSQHERQAAAKHLHWYKATEEGRGCLAANSLLQRSPATHFLCCCTTWLNGDSALSATRAGPQEFPRNSRIFTQGDPWIVII